MKIYTYCSFKNSSIGYQYAKIDINQEDNRSCSRKIFLEENHTFPKVLEWFEDRNGWRMVLKKTKDSSGAYLMVSGLETMVSHENNRRIEKKEEIEAANNFRIKKESADKFELSMLDVSTYINFAVIGEIECVYKMAIGFIETLKKGKGLEFYNSMRKCIKCLENQEGYSVNGKKFWEQLKILKDRGYVFPEKKKSAIEKNIFFNKWIKADFLKPYVRIKSNSGTEKIVVRENPKCFSSDNMIYLSEDDDLEKNGLFNIAINYSYFFRGI